MQAKKATMSKDFWEENNWEKANKGKVGRKVSVGGFAERPPQECVSNSETTQ